MSICRRFTLPGAYPRMHGGNWGIPESIAVDLGLSPHARGKQYLKLHAPGAVGPIPACTGETTQPGWRSWFSGAYPRMHGGNCESSSCNLWCRGLSPHARGKHAIPNACHPSNGPIPACTGETSGTWKVSCALRAYPRMHGGNEQLIEDTSIDGGLSPHARGKLGLITVEGSVPGPIPACTGETCLRNLGSAA